MSLNPNTVEDFLDLDTVRSVLTVSESDLPESVLEGYGLKDDIEIDLDGNLPGWVTMDSDKQVRLLRAYVKYRAASIVAATAPVFVLKKETDGDNEGQRSDKDGFLWLSERMAAKADALMAKLKDDQDIDTSYGFTDLVGRLIPGRDPIIEPRGS